MLQQLSEDFVLFVFCFLCIQLNFFQGGAKLWRHLFGANGSLWWKREFLNPVRIRIHFFPSEKDPIFCLIIITIKIPTVFFNLVLRFRPDIDPQIFTYAVKNLSYIHIKTYILQKKIKAESSVFFLSK